MGFLGSKQRKKIGAQADDERGRWMMETSSKKQQRRQQQQELIHGATQARDSTKRDGGQAGGLGTAVLVQVYGQSARQAE
jgi:hypothetical protein